jgi:two-component system, OmpR family, sensor kinase
MRNSLLLKIYLAFVGITVGCIVLAGVGSHLIRDRGPVPDHVHEVVELFVEALPAEPAMRQQILAERAERLGLDMALLDGDAAVLASHGEVLRPRKDHGDHWLPGRGRLALAVELRDGGWLMLVPSDTARHMPAHLLLLVGMAGLMLLGTWPLARGITRRLERLKQGVDDLGGGNLAARVPADGTDEVAALARSFNRSADRIEALVTAQRSMLASASHELRSPLARLRLAVELMSEADGEAGRGEHRREAVRNIDELDQLIEDLLLIGRLEAGDRGRTGPVELLALAAEEGSRVDADVGGVEAVVEGDEALLRIALRNLLENSQRHGAAPIEVEVVVADDAARVTVSDHGPGIPADERARVFEPFHRAPGQPEGERSGAGLGLAMVARVARRHGGAVVCEPGEGGRFVLELPLRGGAPTGT